MEQPSKGRSSSIDAVVSDGCQPRQKKTSEKKRTVAEFLAAASEMDPKLWEAKWEQALDHVEGVASEASSVISPGHFAPEVLAAAGESSAQSLMEIIIREAVEEASRAGRWSSVARRIWDYGVPLIVHAWNGRHIEECAERFSLALRIFSRRGQVAIDLAQGPEEGTSVVWLRCGMLELAEESCDQVSSWFRRYLADAGVPFEYQRIERDVTNASGSIVSRCCSYRMTVRLEER